MKTSNILIASIIAAFGATSYADEADQPLTRAQVRAEVLKAHASGQLLKAGEIYDGFTPEQSGRVLSRAEVKQQTQQAKAAGKLVPVGEISVADLQARKTFVSTVSRAGVKAEVIAARQAGELIPAGELLYYPGQGLRASSTTFARGNVNVAHGKTQRPSVQ
jgi:hypothetical protein